VSYWLFAELLATSERRMTKSDGNDQLRQLFHAKRQFGSRLFMQLANTLHCSPALRNAALPLLPKARNTCCPSLRACRCEILSAASPSTTLNATSNVHAITVSAQQQQQQLKDWLDIDQPLLWQV
jgi:hypothetical protein